MAIVDGRRYVLNLIDPARLARDVHEDLKEGNAFLSQISSSSDRSRGRGDGLADAACQPRVFLKSAGVISSSASPKISRWGLDPLLSKGACAAEG